MTNHACDKCGKTFGSGQALEQHMQDYDHSKVSTCSTCGETFTSDDAYSEHRRTHMNPVRRELSRLSVTHIAGIGLLAIVVAGVFYAGGLETGTTGEAAAGQQDTVNKTIEVSGGEYYFSPRTISVTEGERVKVTFTNTGRIQHNLRIPDLNVGSAVIGSRQKDSFTFTAPETGTFPINFACTLPGHAENGMVGQVQQAG